MRFISLRSLVIKFVSHRSIAGAAALALVGAAGCQSTVSGGGGIGQEPQPQTVICEPGNHPEQTCWASSDGQEGCEDVCVPDSPCPPGTMEEWSCPASCDAEGCPDPGPCTVACVPVENPCGAGYHEEWVCEPSHGCGDEPGSEPGDEPPPPNPGEPTEPSECYPICVPDAVCPPGTMEQTVCGGGAYPGSDGSGDDPVPPPPEPTCWTECVPMDVCPPGTIEQTVCAEPGSSGGGSQGSEDEPTPVPLPEPPPPEPTCWTECVPAEVCPEGMVEQVVCPEPGDGGSGEPEPLPPCYVECVPAPEPEPVPLPEPAPQP